MYLFDTHAHLDQPEFDADRSAAHIRSDICPGSQAIVLRPPRWLFFGTIASAHIAYAALWNRNAEYSELLVGIRVSQFVVFALWLALGTGRFAFRCQATALSFG